MRGKDLGTIGYTAANFGPAIVAESFSADFSVPYLFMAGSVAAVFAILDRYFDRRARSQRPS